jgi:hypothetical protein
MTAPLDLNGFPLDCPVAFQSSSSSDGIVINTIDPLNPYEFRLQTTPGTNALASLNVGMHLRIIESVAPFNSALGMDLTADAGTGDGVITANGANGSITVVGFSANFVGPNATTASVNVTGDVNVSDTVKSVNFSYASGSAYIGSGQLGGGLGVLVVPFPTIDANDRVVIQRKAFSGTVGELAYSILPGASFTIASSNTADTSTVEWMVFPVT